MDEVVSIVKHSLIIVAGVALFIVATSLHRVDIAKSDKAMRDDDDIGESETFSIDPSIRKPEELVRGNVVAFKPAETRPEWSTRLIRVIALPGDTVTIKKAKKGHRIYVNDAVAPFTLRIDPRYERSPFLVPAGHLYLVFDNAKLGGDSLTEGPIPWRRIIGKAKVD